MNSVVFRINGIAIDSYNTSEVFYSLTKMLKNAEVNLNETTFFTGIISWLIKKNLLNYKFLGWK